MSSFERISRLAYSTEFKSAMDLVATAATDTTFDEVSQAAKDVVDDTDNETGSILGIADELEKSDDEGVDMKIKNLAHSALSTPESWKQKHLKIADTAIDTGSTSVDSPVVAPESSVAPPELPPVDPAAPQPEPEEVWKEREALRQALLHSLNLFFWGPLSAP